MKTVDKFGSCSLELDMMRRGIECVFVEHGKNPSWFGMVDKGDVESEHVNINPYK